MRFRVLYEMIELRITKKKLIPTIIHNTFSLLSNVTIELLNINKSKIIVVISVIKNVEAYTLPLIFHCFSFYRKIMSVLPSWNHKNQNKYLVKEIVKENVFDK